MPKQVWLVLLLSVAITGCRSSSQPAASPDISNSQSYSVRGKIVSTDATHVTLDHDAVPGFMAAMIMPYRLADPAVVSELHPGDLIKATILVHKDASGGEDVELDHILVLAQARPDYKPTVQYHVPAAGDPVPNFALINQSGHTIAMDQFRGKVLLITFIYTRCPLSDFCPRMTRNFAEINESLAAEPSLYKQTHLLSVSFDPEYDTPSVLRAYGAAHIGQPKEASFSHWDFAAIPAKELPAVTQFFNVGITPGDSRTLNHSLSTLILDKQGKVAAWYPTNEWKPADIIEKVKQILAAS